MPSPFEINKAVEAVIAESKQPELARMIIKALNAGQFTEEQQGHAMAILQAWDIDLYDLGLAMLSEQTPEEIERIAKGNIVDPAADPDE
jgi:hypothetical protein